MSDSNEPRNDERTLPISELMKKTLPTCLDGTVFHSQNIKVIGQFNNQVILAMLIEQRLILAFDQHAVHERIRYEQIMNEEFPNRQQLVTKQIMPPAEIIIPDQLAQQALLVQDQLDKCLGFKFTIKTNSSETKIIVTRIPVCFKMTFMFVGSMQDFLQDALKYFHPKKPNNGRRITPYLKEQMRQRACRGAIRFNEPLELKECNTLIMQLTECTAWFRCAHGRMLVQRIHSLGKSSPNPINQSSIQTIRQNKYP